jgi:hypothetical protein
MKPPHPNTSGAPDVECEMHHTTLVVSDVSAAVDFYTTKLGFWTAFMDGDPPTFAGVNLGHVQLFLEQDASQGCSVYSLPVTLMSYASRNRKVVEIVIAEDRPMSCAIMGARPARTTSGSGIACTMPVRRRIDESTFRRGKRLAALSTISPSRE